MKNDDGEGDKGKSNRRNGLKILGVTSSFGALGIINYFFDIIKPQVLFLSVLFALCFILVCFVLLQETTIKIVDRICTCIERKYKSKYNKKSNNKRNNDDIQNNKNDIADGDCKIYKMHRTRKTE